MASVAIICPPLPGHINPMGVLARELIRRGHSVTFLGFPDMRAKLATDLKFMPFAGGDYPPGSLGTYLESLSRLGGMLSVHRLMLNLARFADATCRELPEALDQLQPDALIIDQTDAAASLVARGMGIPFANVANALPMNVEASVPPPVLPWRYDPTVRGIRRNLGGYRIVRMVERPISRVIRRHAERLGVKGVRFADDTWSELCQITQCVRSLDFPREQLPRAFHYVGPFRGPEEPLPFDLPDDARPLLFCSLGSLQGSRIEIFREVARAAAKLDLRLILAHGGQLHDRQIASLAGHPHAYSFVPQRAVLRRSALAVTHAGFNTVMDALSLATPMVALPLTFEQPATAARLERAGVAEVLHRRRTAERIGRAIQHVLGTGTYAANAGRLRDEISEAGGVTRAADLLEDAFGLRALAAVPTRGHLAPDGAGDDIRSESR